MTEQEIRLLRALCRGDQMAYLPQGFSVSALQEFDALMAQLRSGRRRVDPVGGGPVGPKREGLSSEVHGGRSAVYPTRQRSAQNAGGALAPQQWC